MGCTEEGEDDIVGTYTEYYLNVDLKDDVPPEVLSIINASEWMFHSTSYYTPDTYVFDLSYDVVGGHSFIGKGDNKDIEPFLNLLYYVMPWIDAEKGTFIGYTRREGQDFPDLYTKITEDE